MEQEGNLNSADIIRMMHTVQSYIMERRGERVVIAYPRNDKELGLLLHAYLWAQRWYDDHDLEA